MSIRIAPSEKDSKQIEIFFDNELLARVKKFHFRSSLDLFKKVRDLGEARAALAECMDKVAMSAALSMLSKKNYTSEQMIRSLKQIGITRESVERCVEVLKQKNYVNDSYLAEKYIISRFKKGYGPSRILMDLRQQFGSVTPEMERQLREENQVAWLHQYLAKKTCSLQFSDRKEKEKWIASIMRRGFDFRAILEAIR